MDATLPKTPRIMILTPQPKRAESMASTFRETGCAVLVSKGDDADLQDALALQPHVFIVDCNVADACARAFLQNIRRQPSLRTVPIVLYETEPSSEPLPEQLREDPFTARASSATLSESVFMAIRRQRALEAIDVSEDGSELPRADIVMLIDRDGTVLALNDNAAAMLGVESVTAVGLPYIALLHPDMSAHMAGVMRGVAETGKPARFADSSGEKPLDISIYPIFDSAGGIARYAVLAQDVSDRVRMERALRESEERYRQIFETANEGIWVVDAAYRGTLVNARTCDILGYPMEELLGRPITDFLLPEDLPVQRRQIEDRRSGLRGTYEQRLLRKNGTLCWVSISASPLYDADGLFMGSFAMLTDITDRKQALLELKRSELLLREAQRIGRLGSYEWDIRRNVLRVSDELYAILGLPSGTLEEAPSAFTRLLRGEDVERLTRTVQDLVNAGEVLDIDFEIMRPDGDTRMMHFRGEIERDADGTALHMIGIAQDITERRLAEDALRKEKERAQQYLDIAGVMIVVLRRDGTVALVNRRAADILGAEAEAIVDTDWFAHFIPDADRERTRTGFGEIIAGRVESARYFENSIITTQGEQRLIAWHNALLRGTDGTIVGTISSGEDITDRRRAEEALQRAHDQLEERVHIRTRALVEEIAERQRKERQIEESRERLRQLSARIEAVREEEKARISREIHDELGHLLTAIKLDFLSFVSDHDRRDEAMHAEAQQLVALVDSAIETTRRISSELRPGILDHLGLSAALEWQSQQFQQRTKIPCLAAFPDDVGELNLERTTIVFRIYQEILTNIARHANATEVRVSLTLSQAHLQLRVQDNGRGIRHEEMTAPESLGILGMRERAHSIGGTVAIHGVPGRGTSVLLTIPRN